MTGARRFADAEALTVVMREVFGTDRGITAVDRLCSGPLADCGVTGSCPGT